MVGPDLGVVADHIRLLRIVGALRVGQADEDEVARGQKGTVGLVAAFTAAEPDDERVFLRRIIIRREFQVAGRERAFAVHGQLREIKL